MKVGITGANGYVGSRIRKQLGSAGHETVGLLRRPSSQEDRQFTLGAPVSPKVIQDLDAIVHAAWDFAAVGRSTMSVNRDGSLPLIRSAASQGKRVILVSSMSSFEGCRSWYGRAKLDLERAVHDGGGACFRAGVVFGPAAGGIFRAIQSAVQEGTTVPIFGGGHQPLSVSWDRAVGDLTEHLVGTKDLPNRTILAAHPAPMTLRSLVEEIGVATGHDVRMVSVNWRVGWFALRLLELARRSTSFRSDSLMALTHPMPARQRALLEPSPVAFPPLQATLWHTNEELEPEE